MAHGLLLNCLGKKYSEHICRRVAWILYLALAFLLHATLENTTVSAAVGRESLHGSPS